MNNKGLHKSIATKLLPGILALACLALMGPLAHGQDKTDREQAMALYEKNNFVDALPLLEKAASANPRDPVILSRLGFALYATSITEKDPALRRKKRDRARETLQLSQSLGDDSNLTKITLDSLSQGDADAIPFSNMKAAETAMREGEEAFVRGDLDKAMTAYTRALELDPKLYDAAVYAGDVEFKKGLDLTEPRLRNDHLEKAGAWFAKAIAIDANRETAYRYWGDALDRQGKSEEARDKFIEAIIAEPYGRRAYVGLSQWGNRHQVAVGHPRIEIPVNVASIKPGEINIAVDEQSLKAGADDGSSAWLLYGMARAGWMDKKEGGRSEKFARAYPNEPAYRHSLREEADALGGVAEAVQAQMKEKRIKQLTPSLDNLLKISEAGLLEPYILFVRPDAGISRDYFAYRKTNRDKLKQYWLRFVVGPK